MRLNECACMLSAFNDADRATLTVTEDNQHFPAANLKSGQMWTFHRWSAPEQVFELDLGTGKPVDVVAFFKTLLGETTEWRIQLRFEPNGPDVHDSGWQQMFPGLDLYGGVPWGDFDWGGTTINTHMGEYNQQAIYVLPSQTFARYVRITVKASQLNRTLNFVGQAARLWVGEAWQPTHSAVYGSGMGFVDDTTVKQAESGVRHRNKQTVKTRTMRLTLEKEPKLETFYRLVGPILGGKFGSTEFVALLEPREKESLAFQSIYGHLANNSVDVSHAVWNRLGTQLNIVESI